MNTYLQNMFKYKDLFAELVKKDIKIKYRNSILGVFWSMWNPLLMMIILSVLFTHLFVRDIENFPIYVLIGRIVYQFFYESTNFAMDAIHINGPLIRKVYVPKYFYPLSRIGSSFITTLVSLIPLAIVMVFTGIPFRWENFLVVVPLMYLLIISAGVGMLLSSINVFFKDMKHLYQTFSLILMYMTPIFYPISILPESYLPYLYLNPLYPIVEMFRDSLMYGTTFDPMLHFVSVLHMIFFAGIGLFVFYRTQDRFIYHL